VAVEVDEVIEVVKAIDVKWGGRPMRRS